MSYRSWKKKVATEAPLNLQNTSEFPLLGSVKSTKIIQQGVSLAEKLKKTIQAEEELSSTARFQKSSLHKKSESSDLKVLPMPSLFGKLRQEKEQEEQKRAEIQEDEENYRWQISRSMYPPEDTNSLQTQEAYHCSTQENTEEHDHT